MRAHAAEAVEHLADHSAVELLADRMRFLALARGAEIVGEAAAQVPAEVRARPTSIEFASAIAMRNRLIHGYGSVSAQILAETIREDFPRLIASLDAALAGVLPDEAP